MSNRVLRQDAISVISADTRMSAEVDARWTDNPSLTVGQRMQQIDDLCVTVLREHGYQVRGGKGD